MLVASGTDLRSERVISAPTAPTAACHRPLRGPVPARRSISFGERKAIDNPAVPDIELPLLIERDHRQKATGAPWANATGTPWARSPYGGATGAATTVDIYASLLNRSRVLSESHS